MATTSANAVILCFTNTGPTVAYQVAFTISISVTLRDRVPFSSLSVGFVHIEDTQEKVEHERHESALRLIRLRSIEKNPGPALSVLVESSNDNN